MSILIKEKCDVCENEYCTCDIEEGLSYVDVNKWDNIYDKSKEFDDYLGEDE